MYISIGTAGACKQYLLLLSRPLFSTASLVEVRTIILKRFLIELTRAATKADLVLQATAQGVRRQDFPPSADIARRQYACDGLKIRREYGRFKQTAHSDSSHRLAFIRFSASIAASVSLNVTDRICLCVRSTCSFSPNATSWNDDAYIVHDIMLAVEHTISL